MVFVEKIFKLDEWLESMLIREKGLLSHFFIYCIPLLFSTSGRGFTMEGSQ